MDPAKRPERPRRPLPQPPLPKKEKRPLPIPPGPGESAKRLEGDESLDMDQVGEQLPSEEELPITEGEVTYDPWKPVDEQLKEAGYRPVEIGESLSDQEVLELHETLNKNNEIIRNLMKQHAKKSGQFDDEYNKHLNQRLQKEVADVRRELKAKYPDVAPIQVRKGLVGGLKQLGRKISGLFRRDK